MSYVSADEVHPNIYGVQQIADKLTQHIKSASSIKIKKKGNENRKKVL